MRKIILASASPRRRELLERAGLSFTVMPASGEEKRSSEDPAEVVLQLARDKASAVADTLAECEEGTLGSVLIRSLCLKTGFWESQKIKKTQRRH